MKIKDFGVETWINNYEKDCKYNLTTTCVGVLSTEDVLNLGGKREENLQELMNLQLGYGEVFGSSRLRQNICSLYQSATDKNIAIAHGAIGANALVMLSLVEPNDEIVTILPIYEQHYSIPQSFGAKIKKVFLKEDMNWLPDIDELDNAVTKNTKMICMNFPNNPTGIQPPKDFILKIVEIARKNNAYILCDEVYRGLSHNDNPFNDSIFDIYEKGISTGSMSKTFSLPALRLGWICAGEEVIEKINIQRNYHVICVGRINDFLASLAIENKNEIIENNLKICKKHLKMLDDWVNSDPKINYVKPNAGTTALLKYDSKKSSKEFCLNLQRETGVMFLPGAVMEMENYLRIGYCGNFETTQIALMKFSDWLKKN